MPTYAVAVAAFLSLYLAWQSAYLVVLIFVAFALLEELVERRGKGTFWWTYAVFAAWNAATTYWIANAHALGVVATVVINGALMAAAWNLGLALRRSWTLRVRGQFFLAHLPVLATWMAFEKMHDHWGLAFPWLNLGNTFHTTPSWVQWYSWTGASGGTLWVLVVAGLVYRAMSSGGGKALRQALVSLAGPLLVSAVLWWWPEGEHPVATVAVVQPNIDAYEEKWRVPERDQIDKVGRLLVKEVGQNKVDLVVLPETFLPEAREEGTLGRAANDQLLLQALRAHGRSSLFGATTYDFQREPNWYNRPWGTSKFYTVYNSALFAGENYAPLEIYHKGKLVVGAETMPFMRLLKPLLGDWAVELGGTSGSLGVSDERKVFESNGIAVAPIICWENEFSDYATAYSRRGANLLAVITNDGWWGDTPGHVQHMRFSGLRAIEHGKYVVRSANTGISAILSPRGEVLRRLDWEEEGVLVDEVKLISGRTLYVRTGDVLGKLAVVVFFVFLLGWLFSRFFGRTAR